MRVLITGAAGFIGSSVAERLVGRGDTVIGVDNFNEFYDPKIKAANVAEVEAVAPPGTFGVERLDIVHDIERIEALIDAEPVDAICHLAAWAGVRPSIQKPLNYTETNVEGTTRLLELARRRGIKPFVFASSSSVYGARKEVPFREDDRVDDPVSPYAATKKAGELLGYTYSHLHGLHFTGLRFFTVYGPRQRPEMAIHLFARKIIDGLPIPLHGDGSSSRDYTYIDDIADGVVAAIDLTVVTSGYRIYNLGGSATTTLAELVSLLEDAIGEDAIIDRKPDQPGDVPRTFADISRAAEDLDYAPKTPIAEGIPKFVAWLRRRIEEEEGA